MAWINSDISRIAQQTRGVAAAKSNSKARSRKNIGQSSISMAARRLVASSPPHSISERENVGGFVYRVAHRPRALIKAVAPWRA